MKYMILIYGDESAMASANADDMQAMMAKHGAFAQGVPALGGQIVGGEALEASSTATTIRGDVVTDGPFLESKEALGGFYVIEAKDLDQASRNRQNVPGSARWGRGSPDLGYIYPVTKADRIAQVQLAIAEAHRTEWSRVLAAVARHTGDLDLAEDCVEDAYVTALTRWAEDGIPDNPAAWLTTTARRRAIDHLRRGASFRSRAHLLAEPPSEDPPEMDDEFDIPDERLRLVFTCCHPALSRDSQVALTLRLICGLPTEDIAHLFLVPPPTMAARLTRAKKKIAVAKIPYRVPEAAELPNRLSSVLSVIYLLFTTGHTNPRGTELAEPELIRRAFDLVRLLQVLMPDEFEVRGLLALMLMIDARRETRTDAAGDLILLEDQDRSRWDHIRINEGVAIIEAIFRTGRLGLYAIQAAIAATHASSPSWEETDWIQLLHLYDALLALWPSPVVELNRAAVLMMVDGPDVALSEIERLETDDRLAEYQYLPSLKADILRRSGRFDEAARAYDRALMLVNNDAERDSSNAAELLCPLPERKRDQPNS